MKPGKPKTPAEEASRSANDALERRVRDCPAELAAPMAARETADAALRESELRFRSLFEQCRDAILLADGERFLDCNEAAVRMFGYPTKAELLGRNPAELLPPTQAGGQDFLALRRAHRDAISRGGGQVFECLHQRKDGTVFDAEVLVQPIKLKGQRIVQAMVRDITGRKQSEKALREIELRLAHAMSLAQSVAWEYDVASGLFNFSDQYFVLHGTTAQFEGGHLMSAGDFVRKYVHPDDAHQVADEIGKAVATADPDYRAQSECRMFRRDGQLRHVAVSIAVTKDAAGQTLQIHGVTQDITERRRAEERLIQEHDLSEALLSNIPGLFYLFTEKGQFLRWNRQFETVSGYTGEEIARMHPLDIFPAEHKGLVSEQISQVFKTGQGQVEANLLTKQGEQLPFHFTGGAVIVDGQPCMAGVGTDFSGRKRAEQELQQKTALLQAQVNSSIDGILMVDAQGKKTLQNQRVADLFKIPPDIADGNDDATQVRWVTNAVRDPEQFGEKVAYLYAHPNEISRDEIVLKDGMILDRYSAPVIGPDGKYHGRIWTFRDITDRKQSEEVLRQRASLQDQLAHTAAAVPGMIYSLRLRPDGSTQMPYASDALRDIFDLQLQDVVDNAAPVFSLIHPEDIGHVQATITESARTLNPWRDEFRVSHARLGEIWVEGHSVPQSEPDGSILWNGFVQNITERKRAEDALRESERRFSDMLHNLELVSVMLDRDARITYCNDHLLRLTGWRREELLGRDWCEVFLPPGTLDDLHVVHSAALAGRALASHHENEIVTRSGARRLIHWNNSVLRSPAGDVIGTASIGEDITERKQAEEALQQERNLLRTLIDHIPDEIYVRDISNRFVVANASFARLMGVAGPSALIGKSDADFYPPELAADYDSIDQGVFAGRASINEERLLHFPNGQELVMLTTKVPFRNDQGEVIGLIGISHDITQRKQAEEALRASEAEFRALAEAMPQMVWITRPDGWNIYFSQQWMDYTGLTLEASLGHGWNKPFHPDDQQRAMDAWQRAVQHNGPYSLECRLRRADGAYRWWLVRGVQMRNACGEVLKWFGTCTDIHDLKLAGDALQESKRFLHSTLDALSSHIAILDEHGTILEVNDAWNRFARENNFSGGRLGVGDNYLEVCDSASGSFSEEAPVVAKGIRAVMAGQTHEFYLEYPCHGSREQRWFIVRVTRFGGSGPVRLVVAHENITTRRQAESQVRQSQERYRSLIDTARDAIFTLAPDGTFISLNPAIETLAGISRAGWIDKPCTSLVHPDDLPLAREVFHSALEGGSAPIIELRGNPGLARPVILEITLASQKDGSGQVISVLGIGRDITERKRLEAQLFQSQKMETVGKLAGGVAHEFNSLLTTIIGQSELLLDDLPVGSPLAEKVTEIRKAADRAATLTRQLLAYGRKQFLQPKVLNLNQVVANMDEVLRHLMGRENVAVKFVAAPGPHLVKADAGQIEQVILNLAINARDAMPNGGNLTLETAHITFDQDSVGRHPELKPGNYVMLAISDTGLGMSEAVKARAFEPFFTTKAVGQGTGLGLSTCHGIIKQSGGHINLYSEPGRGTTFKIYLPQVDPPVSDPVQRLDSPDLPRGTETILLVEDDPALRDMAALLLRRLGYTVLTAANGVEALSLTHERNTGHIDLLFTDLVMPHIGGKELAERVRALYPHMRILFTSAFTEQAIAHQGGSLPGVALLQKPFAPSALANRVRAALDHPIGPGADPAQGTLRLGESGR